MMLVSHTPTVKQLIKACTLALAVAAGDAQPSSTMSEVPSAVAAVTQRQLGAYFGTNSAVGVPFTNQSVDWNTLTNWPSEFTFQGQTYELHLERWEGDYSVPLKSRSGVKDGMSVFASC